MRQARDVLRKNFHPDDVQRLLQERTAVRFRTLGICTAVTCLCVEPVWPDDFAHAIMRHVLRLRSGFAAQHIQSLMVVPSSGGLLPRV